MTITTGTVVRFHVTFTLDLGIKSFSSFLLASNFVFVLPRLKCAKGKRWVQDAEGETRVKGRIPPKWRQA
jgi:hypothetical protein